MATPWIASIKSSKTLTVFAGPLLLQSSVWGLGLFQKILDEFNRLSTVNKLGVKVVRSLDPPDPQNIGGANVQIETSFGTHTFMFEGRLRTASLPGGAIDIAGVTNSPNLAEQVKAFIFVPATPKVGGASSRDVGDGVKIAVTIHELIHGCGLAENEHSPGSNPDVFMTGGSLSAQFPPNGVPGDRIQLGSKTFVPPIFITARTAGLIQNNWN